MKITAAEARKMSYIAELNRIYDTIQKAAHEEKIFSICYYS